MLHRVIRGCNAAPGAPRNWNPLTDGKCGALPIRVHPPAAILAPGVCQPSLVQYCESAWEPTPQELEWLNAGGSLILRVVGWQVPVALYVDPPEVDPDSPPPPTGVKSAEQAQAVANAARLAITDAASHPDGYLVSREDAERLAKVLDEWDGGVF